MTDHTFKRRDFVRLGALAVASALLPACTATFDRAEALAEGGGTPMNIGIIVYSQTGHTLAVASSLQQKLLGLGHTAVLEQVETMAAAKPNEPGGALKTAPSIVGYDALVFGCPVWGGTPAWPMTGCLDQIGSLEDRRMALLMTGALPAAIGRNQAIAKLTEICEERGAVILGSGSMCWSSLRRERQIDAVVESLSMLF